MRGLQTQTLQRAASGLTLSHPQGTDTSLMLVVQIRNLRCFSTSFPLLSPREGTLSKSALRKLSNHRETLSFSVGCTRLCFIHIKIKGWPWTSQELHFVPLRMCSRRWVQLYENSGERRKSVRTFIPHSFIPPCSTGRMKRGQREQRMNGTASFHPTPVRAQAEGLTLAEPECWLQLEQSLVGRGCTGEGYVHLTF